MAKKLTPAQIEKMAKEIRKFLLDKELWIDVSIYFNGKAYSTTDGDRHFSYNNPNDLIEIENVDPKRFLEYTGEILCMTYEGPLYSCMNGYGEFSRKFEESVISGLTNIFAKYGCYFERGYAWSLALYPND